MMIGEFWVRSSQARGSEFPGSIFYEKAKVSRAVRRIKCPLTNAGWDGREGSPPRCKFTAPGSLLMFPRFGIRLVGGLRAFDVFLLDPRHQATQARAGLFDWMLLAGFQ